MAYGLHLEGRGLALGLENCIDSFNNNLFVINDK